MKKILTLLWVLLLLCMPLLMLGSCNKTPDDPNADQPGDDPSVDNGPSIMLVENGVSNYRVIRSDFANSTVSSLAGSVRAAIAAVTGVKPDMKTDWENKDNNADIKEILIGKTNRVESTEAIASLKTNEYTIRVVGNKIVIAADTDDLLGYAVREFLSKYVGYKSENDYISASSLSIPENLSLTETFNQAQNITLYVTNDSIGYVDDLQKALTGVGDKLTLKTRDDDPEMVFNINESGIVLIAGADRMPNTSIPAIRNYLNAGGRMIMLGGPAFETTLLELDGEWLSYDECLSLSTNSGKKQVILDTSSKSLEYRLERQTNDTSATYRWSVGDYGLKDSEGQLFHEVDNLSGWDTFRLNLSYPKGDYSTITLYAKPGDDHTTGFYVELHEKGGIRWTAGISFTSEDWAYYVLSPEDFAWFKDGSSTSKDIPDLNNIEMLQIGFASQAAVQTQGHHSYYIADVTLCTPTVELPDLEELELDGVAPLYEQYPITNAANIETYENQIFVKERDYTLPEGIISCNPGRQGLGYNNGRTSRFVPLLRVTDEKGLHSGYAAWMHIYSSTTNKNADMEGAIVACFGATSEDFYDENGLAAIRDVVEVMARDIFLVEGGTDEFIYVAEDTEEITAGISYVAMNGVNTSNLVATVSLYKGDQLIKEYSSTSFSPSKQKITSIPSAACIICRPDSPIAQLRH